MIHLERQLRDTLARLLAAEPSPAARVAQVRALDALLNLTTLATLLEVIDGLRAQESRAIEDPTYVVHLTNELAAFRNRFNDAGASGRDLAVLSNVLKLLKGNT